MGNIGVLFESICEAVSLYLMSEDSILFLLKPVSALSQHASVYMYIRAIQMVVCICTKPASYHVEYCRVLVVLCVGC